MADLDSEGLSEEFNIDNVESEVTEMSNQVKKGNFIDIEDVIRDNINRANRILDRIEHEVKNGNFSARLSEVASQLINSVTQAASQVSSDRYNIEYLQLRHKVLELERKKLEIREGSPKNSGTTNQNIIVTDTKSLLKFLKTGQSPKQIEEGGINE